MDKRYLKNEAETWILRVVGLCGLTMVFNVVLLMFVVWREDPVFWKNQGGYPIWLREFVLDAFYPLELAQLVLLVAASICLGCVGSFERSFRVGGLVAVTLLWLLFGGVLTIQLWNNVDNLLHGRDIHYHPS